jgi:YD repeat-containing protein
LAKDARARQWRYGYSANGLLTEVEDPQPNRVVLLRNEYNDAGRVVRQRDALGNTTTFEWDAGTQEAKTTDADGVVVHDGNGSLNRSLVVDAKHNQHEAQFDANGNPIVRAAPQSLGFDEKTRYDERNNPIEPPGRRTQLRPAGGRDLSGGPAVGVPVRRHRSTDRHDRPTRHRR